jgi:hypothetical protein
MSIVRLLHEEGRRAASFFAFCVSRFRDRSRVHHRSAANPSREKQNASSMTKSMRFANHRMVRTVLMAVLCSAVVQHASMQTLPTGAWAGWARCQVDVQGPGYTEHQTHTWTIAGGTPTVEGAFRVYPGTWSVVGGGTLQRTQGTQTLMAQWAVNVPATSAPIAVFVRASDGRMLIQARHTQLRSSGAVAGYQQQTIDGKLQPPSQISAEAFEWSFPVIDGASTSTSVSGSSAPGVNGSVGYMQPAGSRGTASCTWQLGQGAAAPAPPSILAAQAIPIPSSTGPTPAVSSQAASTATTTGSTTGIRVIGGSTGVVSGGATVAGGDATAGVGTYTISSGGATLTPLPGPATVGSASCTSTSCTLTDIAAAFDNMALSVEEAYALILRELDNEIQNDLRNLLQQLSFKRTAVSKDRDKILADIASAKQKALQLGSDGQSTVDWKSLLTSLQAEFDAAVASYTVQTPTATAR